MIETKPYEQQIEEIMDYFEFARVHKTMKALNWTWARENGVPDEGALRKVARGLMRDVIKTGRQYSSSGGFEVTNTDGYLELKFVVAEWHGNDR